MLPDMHIEDQGIPIYVQIREQMLRAIGAGILKPGEQLPTMRQLAVTLKVDLNTVRHAYEELEATGAIVIQRARGSFVASRPPDDRGRQGRRARELAQQLIATARSAGIDPATVARQILQLVPANGEKP